MKSFTMTSIQIFVIHLLAKTVWIVKSYEPVYPPTSGGNFQRVTQKKYNPEKFY